MTPESTSPDPAMARLGAQKGEMAMGSLCPATMDAAPLSTRLTWRPKENSLA